MRIVQAVFVAASVAAAGSPAVPSPAIRVSTLESLYAAINDPANAGATVVVAPGHYVLTRLASGIERSNGGRLSSPT